MRPTGPTSSSPPLPELPCGITLRSWRRGGCDNCARRAAGEEAERDLGAEAGLLLAAVGALRGHYGAGKPVALLRGSRGRDMPAWLLEATAPDGTRLHGAPLPAFLWHAGPECEQQGRAKRVRQARARRAPRSGGRRCWAC